MTGPTVVDEAVPAPETATPVSRPPERRRRRGWAAAVVLALAFALVGCSGTSDDSGIPSGDRSGDVEGSGDRSDDEAQQEEDREGIDGGFGEVAVTITAADGETCDLCLLHADTPELRSQGLMRVTDPDLGGYDGMLFDHGTPSPGAYWMQNTPMPLSIAYWDGDGEFVSSVDMEPCLQDQADHADEPGGCPTYPADEAFRFALEVPQGGLAEVLAVEGSTLAVGGDACALAPT